MYRIYSAVLIFAVCLAYVLAQSTVQPPTTTQTVEAECAKLNSSCEDCVSQAKCLWCNSRQQKCIAYPVGQIIPHSDVCPLSDARWGVCWMNYEALLISMGVIAGVLIISLCCCIYCCCCRSKGNAKKWAREDAKYEREREERRVKHEERKTERKAKYDEIRKKYGLVKDDTPYQRFDDQA